MQLHGVELSQFDGAGVSDRGHAGAHVKPGVRTTDSEDLQASLNCFHIIMDIVISLNLLFSKIFDILLNLILLERGEWDRTVPLVSG